MTARRRLLLVGWDSADWKIIHPLLDAGAMPAVARLVEHGSSGNLTTLEPQLSPMLWTSIATGKMAYHHRVPGFTEVDPRSGKVVPVSAATRQARTLWEMLGERGLKSHVVSWFATHGERNLNGCMVSNMYCHVRGAKEGQDPSEWPPSPPGTFWPESLRAELDPVRVSIHDLDPDQILRLFVPEAHLVDQEKDKRLFGLGQRLSETFSVHEAATHLLANHADWDFMAVYYRAIDEVCHQFMPYHPPRMDGIPEKDFDLYRHVVTGIYRLHDLLLARLMQLAGPDTAVVLISDHGFHSDHLRPKFTPRVPAGITVWHRPQGVFAAAGPGFAKDKLVYGARLLDVAPTVLHWFGLPVGADMEGRVLEDAFDPKRPVETVPTWERPDAPRRERASFGEEADKALLEQFQDLGYIDEIPDDTSRAAEETNRENDWNIARACLHGQRFDEALPLLEACFHARPARTDYAQALASCQMQLGLLDEADATIAVAAETFGRTEQAELVRASIALQKGDGQAALDALDRVREKSPDEVQLQFLLAQSYFGLRQWRDAEAAALRTLERDPHHARAKLLLARIEMQLGRPAEAASHALDAIGLQFGNPLGHHVLGRSLAAQGLFAEAERAFANALSLEPEYVDAMLSLAESRRNAGRPDLAEEAESKARAVAESRKIQATERLATRRRESAERAAIRAEADRNRPAPPAPAAAEGGDAAVEKEFLIVSGLPRSGTSLMMQILRAGGIEPMTDSQRAADEDNPEGYWEWEEIKKLAKDPAIIEKTEGKAVKVISALLTALPGRHRYTVIYMVRPPEQVVDSQWAMLSRRGRTPRSERQHLIDTQRNHSRQIREVLRKSSRVRLYEVFYPDLIADPAPVIARLAELLPDRFRAGPEVAACVKPALFRNRGGAGAG
jgi:tetratricopeptide (TPR) repeat protein